LAGSVIFTRSDVCCCCKALTEEIQIVDALFIYAITFDPEKLVRVGRLYNLETRIQTKIADGVSDVDNVGSGEETQTLLYQPSKEDVTDVSGVGGM
jgi:hypothetical protein